MQKNFSLVEAEDNILNIFLKKNLPTSLSLI